MQCSAIAAAVLSMAAIAHAEAFAGAGEPFTVVAWNVGHHAMGIRMNPTIPPGQDDEYAREYKAFIGDARIVGISEYSELFSTNSPRKTVDVLYGDYDVKLVGSKRRRCPQGNSLFMKGCRLIEAKERDYPKRQRAHYYQFARVEMDGREVCVVETHLDWFKGMKDPLREMHFDQINTLIEDLKDEKYVILMGDFNISRMKGDTDTFSGEYDIFAKAGYTLANKGEIKTWPSYKDCKGKPAPLDNIMVKGFEMSDVQMKSSDKLSDHSLLCCKLRFADPSKKQEGAK